MYIQPNSSITVYFNVPLDNTYNVSLTPTIPHTEKINWLNTHYNPRNLTNYTYLRENNSIRIDLPYSALLNANYLVYRNINHENKYYYCFINEVRYINDNTTELIIEEDVMNTWSADYNMVTCFVEREHVMTDGIGDHLQAEPVDIGDLTCLKFEDLLNVLRNPNDAYSVILSVNEATPQ